MTITYLEPIFYGLSISAIVYFYKKSKQSSAPIINELLPEVGEAIGEIKSLIKNKDQLIQGIKKDITEEMQNAGKNLAKNLVQSTVDKLTPGFLKSVN